MRGAPVCVVCWVWGVMYVWCVFLHPVRQLALQAGHLRLSHPRVQRRSMRGHCAHWLLSQFAGIFKHLACVSICFLLVDRVSGAQTGAHRVSVLQTRPGVGLHNITIRPKNVSETMWCKYGAVPLLNVVQVWCGALVQCGASMVRCPC